MKKLLLSLCLFSASMAVKAQVDPHFSEYYVYPSWLNPALTGAIDGDYRISAIYRNQWGNIANGFSTIGLSGDVVTNRNINIGGAILQQTAGNGGYTYLTAYASVAYTGLKFGKDGNQHIAFGLQAGFMQRRFNTSKFQLGDQWNPITGYNPSTATADVFTNPSSSVFDAAAGVTYYDASPNRKANIFLGYSASHLTQPDDKFTTGTVKGKIPMRHTIHGGIKLNLSETFSITPNGLYLRQGNSEEKMVGAYGQLRATDNLDVLLGANLRWNDAISPFAGFWYRNFTLGLAYDINNSQLGKMVGTTNSFELSLSYTGRRNKELAGKNFTCPRL
jgi:type IX secretion system PorP/SprF family membrane protein